MQFTYVKLVWISQLDYFYQPTAGHKLIYQRHSIENACVVPWELLKPYACFYMSESRSLSALAHIRQRYDPRFTIGPQSHYGVSSLPPYDQIALSWGWLALSLSLLRGGLERFLSWGWLSLMVLWLTGPRTNPIATLICCLPSSLQQCWMRMRSLCRTWPMPSVCCLSVIGTLLFLLSSFDWRNLTLGGLAIIIEMNY